MSYKSIPNPFDDFSDEEYSDDGFGEYELKGTVRKADSYWNSNRSGLSQLLIRPANEMKSIDNTVYSGTSGIALLYLRKSQALPSLLKDALDYLYLDQNDKRRVSFLCGDAGPLAIGAIIYERLHRKQESVPLIQRLIALKPSVLDPKSDRSNELLYGRVGYLYALLFVNKHITPAPIDSDLIKDVISVVLMTGRRRSKYTINKLPLTYDWHKKHYLGAAHGFAGIMYILLQAQKYISKTELNTLIRPTIDGLMNLRFKSGNFRSSLESDTDRLVQWCHGSPGFTHLFCKAYELFKEDKYLNFALECGEVVWKRGILRKGYSLCHGVAGNGYTFLALYQATKEPRHLYRASKFAEWCIDYKPENESIKPDRPLSLFEGIAGRLYFLEDIKDPLNAKFPGFQL